jgi:DNA-binding CsgD family transcriptional regulator/tetratricopeptide (TPR) repeat protein
VHTAADSPDRPVELLERQAHLAVLEEQFARVAATARGRVVLISGEAGVGKTALVRQFCRVRPPKVRVLTGACDALFTPAPLGPFLDVALLGGEELAHVIKEDGRPYEVAAALMRDLRSTGTAILVLEDVHWADEATLDVMKLVARRVETIPTLVLVTYRDEELDAVHPLRILLGELPASEPISRVKLAALSPSAVAELARPQGVDAAELFRKTGGNPFFVTEALAVSEGQIPETVRDAVLARAGRLTPGARTLLEAVALIAPQVELWLLEALAPESVDRVDECLAAGMLVANPGGVGFRHELARLAFEDRLTPMRRLALHRRALEALAAPPNEMPNLARLAHHAEAAGDGAAVLRYAPAAATVAASVGAHRESAAQYARALRFAGGLTPQARGDLYALHSYESYVTGQFGAAVEAGEAALDCHRRSGDSLKEGDSLRSLSRLWRYIGRTEEAARAGRQAVTVLEQLPAGHELAMAYSNLSHLYMNVEDRERTIEWGTKALELARRLGDVEAEIYAATNINTVEYLAGDTASIERLERWVERAKGAGLEEHAGRAYNALTWWAGRSRSFAVADRYLSEGLDYVNEHGLDLWRPYLIASRARAELSRGHWDAALDSAALILRGPRLSPVPRVVALSVLGLVRARRGDPDHGPPLEEAWQLAEPTAELQRIEPIAIARAEVAWLEGRPGDIADETAMALELSIDRSAPWPAGELACWRWRAGLREVIPAELPEPYAYEMAGDWERAAEAWTTLGCPYDAALALAGAEDDSALRRSHSEFLRLGARAAAVVVARRLRERGARNVPRGLRSATAGNPARLTRREVEVAALVAKGLRDAEIAERLFLSQRTVGHHVSAILRKLGVANRVEAATEAMRLGLADTKPR